MFVQTSSAPTASEVGPRVLRDPRAQTGFSSTSRGPVGVGLFVSPNVSELGLRDPGDLRARTGFPSASRGHADAGPGVTRFDLVYICSIVFGAFTVHPSTSPLSRLDLEWFCCSRCNSHHKVGNRYHRYFPDEWRCPCCYRGRNYLESSPRSMSRNMFFQEFPRTLTHQFQNSL